MLKKLGVVKSKTKGYKIFTDHVESDFLENSMGPSEYVNYCWKKYTDAKVSHSNAMNGTIFELIISSLLIKEGILPLYLQAQVAFVPNVNFDAILYTKESGPIGLSLKTSLRERYKQADLEAIALKYVHRKAENYLLTMDTSEAESVSKKIKSGDILGINKAILTTSPEFDDFINKLKSREFIDPGKVDVITSSSVITTDTVKSISK